jgi:hypothetical protein
MKITIDTKEDSHDDIKKVMQILTHMVGHKDESSVMTFNEPSTSDDSLEPKKELDTTNMMSMFGSEKSEEEVKEIADTAPDFTSLMDLTRGSEEKKENDDEAKIEFF